MYSDVKYIVGGRLRATGEYKHITRTISSYEIIIVTEGELFMEVDGEELHLLPGDVLFIRPGEHHGGYKSSYGVSFYWLHFLGLKEEEMLPRRLHPESTERVVLLAREVLHYSQSDGYPASATDNLIRVLLAEITHTESDEGRLIADIKRFVRENIKKQIKVTDISEALLYNEDHINRVFKKRCGIGLKKHIDTQRTDMLKRELLAGRKSAVEIAEEYGFSDYKYFLKYFKYHTEVTPSEFKETYYKLYTN